MSVQRQESADSGISQSRRAMAMRFAESRVLSVSQIPYQKSPLCPCHYLQEPLHR